jgi:hypothetical protein
LCILAADKPSASKPTGNVTIDIGMAMAKVGPPLLVKKVNFRPPSPAPM